MTVRQFATALGVTRETAYKLVGFLLDMELISISGTVKVPGAKGRGETVYHVPGDLPEKLLGVGRKLVP